MKKLSLLLAITGAISGATTASAADVTGQATQNKPDFRRNQSFPCVGSVKEEQAAVLIARPDGEKVTCVVREDVRSANNGTLVIPKGSRFVGQKDGRFVEWASWMTPGFVIVNMRKRNRRDEAPFVSSIEPRAAAYTVVANRDIIVPAEARH